MKQLTKQELYVLITGLELKKGHTLEVIQLLIKKDDQLSIGFFKELYAKQDELHNKLNRLLDTNANNFNVEAV